MKEPAHPEQARDGVGSILAGALAIVQVVHGRPSPPPPISRGHKWNQTRGGALGAWNTETDGARSWERCGYGTRD